MEVVPQMLSILQLNSLLDFQKIRKAIAAISLVTDTSTISAIGNDFGFKYIFSRQIESIGVQTMWQ